MPTSSIGPLVAPWNVEQAVLATVKTWLDHTLAEVERQNGMVEGFLPRPPADDSYFGGVDFSSWQEDMLPSVIVTVAPTGAPEWEPPNYGQLYEVELAVPVIRANEDEARMHAGLYAAAVMGAVGQHGGLGGFATRTRLVGAPNVRFLDPDKMNVAHGVCVFHVFVAVVLNEQGGLSAVPTPPESAPPAAPGVKQAVVDYTAKPATKPVG